MRVFIANFLILTITSTAWSRPTTHQPASSVLGQPNFAADTAADPPTARSLDNPYHIAIDPTTGKLFVADYDNHRVLRFSSAAVYQTNSAAEAVFGQPDFTTKAVEDPPTASSLRSPAALIVDAQGRLWVSDEGNKRVLRFDDASTKSTGADADAVLGQDDFTSNAGPGAGPHSGFDSPGGLAVDSAGRLWVADFDLNRILRFDDAATLSGKATADGVLGQPDLNTFTSSTTSTTLDEPWGLCMDDAGRLWVGDYGNVRVLRYDNAAGKMDGDPADGVLGQSDFDSDDSGLAADMFEGPYFPLVGPDGTLWVDDYSNSRVLGFLDGANKANGAAADIVLGQANFTTDLDESANARSTPGPYGLAIGRNGSLLVNDYSSHRVMVFEDPAVDNSALRKSFKNKIKKLKKKLKKAKKSGNSGKAKKIKKQIKKLKKKLKAL